MKSLICGLFLLVASVANAGVIYQNGPEEHMNFFVRTDAAVEILPDLISLDIIGPGDTTLVLQGMVDTTTFQLENISFTVNTVVPVTIGYIGAIHGGTISGGLYEGGTGETSYDFYLGNWFSNIEIIIGSSSPNTLVLSNFVVTGQIHHLPEPSAVEYILIAMLCGAVGWLFFTSSPPDIRY